jgi:hypothetical protein
MSWDVVLIAANDVPPPVADMPSGWSGESLGSHAQVRAKIDACIPDVDWSDPNWGVYEGAGFTFEFNIGREEQSEGIMVHVRGSGAAVPPLLSLASRCGWFLLDLTQGEWLHHCESPEAGWQEFQAFRDRALGQSSIDERR